MGELSLAGALWFVFWGTVGLFSCFKWAQFAWGTNPEEYSRRTGRKWPAGSRALRLFKFLCVCFALVSALGLFIGLKGLYPHLF